MKDYDQRFVYLIEHELLMRRLLTRVCVGSSMTRIPGVFYSETTCRYEILLYSSKRTAISFSLIFMVFICIS
jgi:hypothetical protein